MAQKSYPWPGVTPGSGADAGRYTAPEWWASWCTLAQSGGVVLSSPLLRTIAAKANIGVYYSVANRLVVTSPGVAQISVDTGAWLNDGQIGYNDTAISAIAITAPAANPRIDRVVIRKNYTSATYSPTNVATDDFDVPPYTARVSIISGTEAAAPAAPALVQDTARNSAGVFGTDGTWDIPLFQYEIAVGGAISDLTDEREWVDAETKTFLVPPLCGRNVTDGTAIDVTPWALGSIISSVELPDNKDAFANGKLLVRDDFLDNMIATSIVNCSGAGAKNVFCQTIADYGACGELMTNEEDTSIVGAYAISSNNSCIAPVTLASPDVGDIVELRFRRIGGDASDTIGGTVHVLGWSVEYLGWK